MSSLRNLLVLVRRGALRAAIRTPDLTQPRLRNDEFRSVKFTQLLGCARLTSGGT